MPSQRKPKARDPLSQPHGGHACAGAFTLQLVTGSMAFSVGGWAMRRLPSLGALKTFECAARHGHFGHAAAELCVTDSAVSHQIRQLEEQLGVALFLREGRNVRPTPAAGRLMQRLQQAFEMIEEACDQLRDPASSAVLRLAVTTELAQKWLVSRLGDFSSRYPHIIATSTWARARSLAG